VHVQILFVIDRERYLILKVRLGLFLAFLFYSSVTDNWIIIQILILISLTVNYGHITIA